MRKSPSVNADTKWSSRSFLLNTYPNPPGRQYMTNRSGTCCIILVSVLTIFTFSQCTTDPPVPKPRTFPRMTFPERIPASIDLPECPFTFNFPTYAQVNRNSKYFDEAAPHPCWFDLHLDDFNADLFLSYHPIAARKDFDKLVGDTYKIANQINRRSDYMEESSIVNSSGVSGMKFLFEGAAASPIHFYLSDTTHHFLKGALYYNEKVRPDSLLPATQFIMDDIDGMLASFRWR